MPIIEPRSPGQPYIYILDGFIGGIHSHSVFTRTALQDTECSSAHNVEFYPIGVISKRNGRVKKHTTAMANTAITQIYQWWSTTGASELLVFSCSSGSVSADIRTFVGSGGDGTFTIVSSASAAASAWNPDIEDAIVCETFAGSALAVNGINMLYGWNATGDWSYITTAPTAARCMRGFKNSLFLANVQNAASTEFGSRVCWSSVGDPTTWPASNFIDLDPDDGDEIVAMEITGNELIVFKEKKVFAIAYVGGILSFEGEIRLDGIGCISTGGVTNRYGDLVFCSGENVFSFDGTNLTELSSKIKDIYLNINPAKKGNIQAVPYEEKNQIWISVPYLDSERNNLILVYDYDRDNWTIFSQEASAFGWYNLIQDITWADLTEEWDSYNIEWGSRLLLSNLSLVITGTYNGFLLDNDTSGVSSDEDSTNIDGFWRSKWLDLGDSERTKRVVRMTVLVEKESDYDLECNIYTDWDEATVAQAKTINLYGTKPILERRLDFTLQARAFQLEFRSRYKNQPFKIHRINITYYIKGKTLVG